MADGACRALIAEAADDPGPAEAMGCGRAVDIPEMGSVLVAGHSPFGALVLRVAQAEVSVPLEGATPLACDEEADMVEVVDACDDRDEDELVRWALLRGMNMAPPPLGTPSALHACRLMFWKFTGGATAVIGDEGGAEGRGVDSGSLSLFPGEPSSPCSAARPRRDGAECNQQRQQRAATRSCTHASRPRCGLGAERRLGDVRVREVVVGRVLVGGARATGGRDAGAAGGLRAQQQGRRGRAMAIEAADRAGGWAEVGGLDGLRFGERRRSLSGLVPQLQR